MNLRAKNPFVEGISPSAFPTNTSMPQPDGCGVMALDKRLPGYEAEIYAAFPTHASNTILRQSH